MQSARGSQRFRRPDALKQIVSRVENQTKPNRLSSQLESMIGRKTSIRRWSAIKQKYSVKDKASTCVPSEIILRINVRQRLKSQAEVIRHERLRTDLIERLSTPKHEKPAFFSFTKRNIGYIESHQETPKEAGTPQSRKNRTSIKSFWDYDLNKKHRRRYRTEHPIMEMYKSASENVVESVRANRKHDSPFDWFASFEDLHPY